MATASTVRVQPRPSARTALILALLGLPGSTIAWGLPAGGYWIGMPLAVAAIVVGMRCRAGAERRVRVIAAVAIVLAAVEIIFTASWTLFG